MVEVDLDVTPKIEVTVSKLSPGGKWSLGINMGSTVNTAENRQCTGVPELLNVGDSGTFTVDLKAMGLFKPVSGRAKLMLSPLTPDTTVTVKSIRFLDASGKEPSQHPYAPPMNEFAGLGIAPHRDLTDKEQWPQLQEEESACQWSLAHQRRNCDPSSFASVSSAQGGWWILQCLDYAIAKKSYLFFQSRTLYKDYPNIDTVLAGLTPPAKVHGWISNDEHYSCMKLGQYGAAYSGGPAENTSFWQWVPLDKPGPVSLPKVRQVAKLEEKCYVNFSWASGDGMEISYSLMDGHWQDPSRGRVPMTWGLNSNFAEFAPAVAEYFAKTATPMDSFWVGPNGAGYTHTGAMPPDRLKSYAEQSRRSIRNLGTSRAIDYWDAAHQSFRPEALDAYTQTATSPLPPVELFTLLPNHVANKALNLWLEDGTPVVVLDQLLFSKWQFDGKTTPESLASDIMAAAAKHPERGPLFLTANVRFSPGFLEKTAKLLPVDRFTIVGMPDFIGLAQEAGGLVAIPFSSGVGAGDSIKISLELHNASGKTGGPGTVRWTLPAGWTASLPEWKHGKIPERSVLRQIVTFTPPAEMVRGTASIVLSDDRFPWPREVRLITYPGGRAVTDGQNTAGWIAHDGAEVSLRGNMIRIAPKQPFSEFDHANGLKPTGNGRVTHALGAVDFDRAPVLEVEIPEQFSMATAVGIIDEQTKTYKELARLSEPGTLLLDLRENTGWKARKDLAIVIDPATSFGSYVHLRCVKLHYQQ